VYEYLKNRTIGDVESISFDHDTSVIETQNERFTQSRVERIIENYKFTQREKQILTFILTGIQIKEIARELFISERTVKFHISNILIKSGVRKSERNFGSAPATGK
jgi:DNA-binding NarL/FixJ family response regulator